MFIFFFFLSKSLKTSAKEIEDALKQSPEGPKTV